MQGRKKRAKSDGKRRGEEAAGANPIWPGAPSLSARVRLLAAIWREEVEEKKQKKEKRLGSFSSPF